MIQDLTLYDMKNYFFIIIVLFTLSCSKQDNEKCNLKITLSLAETEWSFIKKEIFPEFEKKNSCTIEPIQIDAASLPKLLEVGKLSGESQIDLFAQDNMQLSILIKKGLVEPLDRLEPELSPEIFQTMIDAGKFDNKLFFIPFRPNVQIFYYNKEKFKKYNLELPKSWEEFLSIAKTFHKHEKTGRVLLKGFGGAVTTTQLYEFIISAGGDPFSFNDDGCIKTFDYFKELWKYASFDSKKAKWDTSNDYIARDSVYFMQNWPFGYKIITQQYRKKNIGVYHGFSGPEREAHVIGGDVFGVPIGNKNKKIINKFILYMTSKEVQQKLIRIGWLPIRPDAYGETKSPELLAAKKALEFGVFRKNVPYWSEFQKLIEEAFLSIVINNSETKITLDSFHNRMNKVKQKYNNRK